MADDLDRFVLQYSVDLKDSIKRLEMLQDKMEKVSDGSKNSASKMKQFAADASSELGKLVPGLNAVSSAVRVMGAEFAAATVALGFLAAGVKSVMDMRERYNMQRSEGMQLGVSATRIEDYQRKMVRMGRGYVTRDSALEGVKTFSDMANTAYTDPTRLGREARTMRMLGVDVGARGEAATGTNTRLTQLAMHLQGMSVGQVQGVAKSTGLSQDWLLTLQRLGPSIGKITDMTSQEIAEREKAEGSLSKYNDSVSQLTEQFTRAENVLAQELLPTFTKFVDLLTDLSKLVPTAVHNLSDHPLGQVKHTEYAPSKAPGWLGIARRLLHISDPVADEPKKAGAADKQQQKQAAKKEQDTRDAAVDKMDESNKQGLQTANTMALAVNMFAGAVQSFSSAINIQQAWAAWAGELGRANNLPGSTGSGTPTLSGGGRGNWTANQYGNFIQDAAKKYGVDPQMLYAIMMTESHGVNGQYSPTGAGGVMQVTRGNWKAYGNGADVMDPAANIMVGARIWKESLARAHGDVAQALRYYNGNSDPNYVSKVSSNYGGSIRGIGESKEKINIRNVQQSIADWLHVPVDQIQRGGVSRGDASWARSQIEAGIQNNIYGIQKQLSVGGLPQQDYAKLQQELAMQSRGLDLMRQYSGGVVDSQPVGDRQRTIGEMPITININGVTDPKAVGQAVNDALRKSMTDLLVNNATGIKG
ncbi:lytic transglycosylase domain-containing protein [Burkholderia anthina]|uniref:lytic transglycosylase domain-containing protein n=1 Tax=Burkholderia anthina TaxID=179879 RepID=UPI00158E10C9|nr:lytic transglycosylase domain-containing protein [Burkholderia anthina]